MTTVIVYGEEERDEEEIPEWTPSDEIRFGYGHSWSDD